MIYISHPYGGKEENKAKIENIIKRLSTENKGVFVSPVHTFGFMYDFLTYERGLVMCLTLLKRCDGMFVYGDWEASRGCKAEVEFAKQHVIPYVIVDD